MTRSGYHDSVRKLEQLGYLEEGQAPNAAPDRRPQFDDELLGIQFFRTRVSDADLSSLTLPGTYFGRSEIIRTAFRNTDLRLSTLCWNDFIEVDLRDACLADCDLRAALFERCEIEGADLRGAILSRDCSLPLSASQREAVVWSDEEPDGG